MKYLIYCGPGIGDLILILPMVKRIKAVDENGFIALFMTSDHNRIEISKQMLELQSEINLIDYYSLKEKKHIPEFLIRIGRHRYDWGFSLQYTDNDNTSVWPYRIISLMSKKTCGIKLNFHPEVKYDKEIERIDGYRIVDYPMKMLDAIGMEKVKLDYTTLLDKHKLNLYYLETKLGSIDNLVSIVIGAAQVGGKINGSPVKNDTKNWSYNRWLDLSKRFIDKGFKVALLGGNKERDELKELVLPDGAENLLGKCPIIQSISIIEKSIIVIGADTGLMHCAGALNVPSLTLFGCTDYREYLPFGDKSEYITLNLKCSPCFGTEKALTCKSKECMNEIDVDKVFNKALKIINQEKVNESKTK